MNGPVAGLNSLHLTAVMTFFQAIKRLVAGLSDQHRSIARPEKFLF